MWSGHAKVTPSNHQAAVAIEGGVEDVTALAGDINVTSNPLSDARWSASSAR